MLLILWNVLFTFLFFYRGNFSIRNNTCTLHFLFWWIYFLNYNGLDFKRLVHVFIKLFYLCIINLNLSWGLLNKWSSSCSLLLFFRIWHSLKWLGFFFSKNISIVIDFLIFICLFSALTAYYWIVHVADCLVVVGPHAGAQICAIVLR